MAVEVCAGAALGRVAFGPAMPPALLLRQAGTWLAALLQDFVWPEPLPPVRRAPRTLDAAACAEWVFGILGERRFTHLSRRNAGPYRAAIVSSLQADIVSGHPLRFCWDLGPGYHASLSADFGGLRFEPGLGELLALRQIRLLDRAVRHMYPPGVRFALFIDDLCASAVNDVPLASTSRYVRLLSAMLGALAMDGCVNVQAESALVDVRDLQRAMAQEPLPQDMRSPAWLPSETEVQNVSRFVGHACSVGEARQRTLRYLKAQAVSARLLSDRVEGVRLTQRASAATFGFRSFPGGDARLQCGEVDLLIDDRGRLRPHLFTRSQHDCFRRLPISGTDLPAGWPLPPGVAHVLLPMPTAAIAVP